MKWLTILEILTFKFEAHWVVITTFWDGFVVVNGMFIAVGCTAIILIPTFEFWLNSVRNKMN